MKDLNLDELEALLTKATPLPWEWWTSNSLRRLSGPDGKDGGVLHAFRSSDGVPDVAIREGDMELIAAAINALPSLLKIARDYELVMGCTPGESATTANLSDDQLVLLDRLCRRRVAVPIASNTYYAWSGACEKFVPPLISEVRELRASTAALEKQIADLVKSSRNDSLGSDVTTEEALEDEAYDNGYADDDFFEHES